LYGKKGAKPEGSTSASTNTSDVQARAVEMASEEGNPESQISDSDQEKRFTSFIICMALNESAVILGLVATFTGEGQILLFATAAVSLCLNFVMRPNWD